VAYPENGGRQDAVKVPRRLPTLSARVREMTKEVNGKHTCFMGPHPEAEAEAIMDSEIQGSASE